MWSSSSPDDVYLVLDLDRAQAVVDLVRHPVPLQAAPPAVDPRVDVVPPPGQVRAPVDAELVRHQLGAGGAVPAHVKRAHVTVAYLYTNFIQIQIL